MGCVPSRPRKVEEEDFLEFGEEWDNEGYGKRAQLIVAWKCRDCPNVKDFKTHEATPECESCGKTMSPHRFIGIFRVWVCTECKYINVLRSAEQVLLPGDCPRLGCDGKETVKDLVSWFPKEVLSDTANDSCIEQQKRGFEAVFGSGTYLECMDTLKKQSKKGSHMSPKTLKPNNQNQSNPGHSGRIVEWYVSDEEFKNCSAWLLGKDKEKKRKAVMSKGREEECGDV